MQEHSELTDLHYLLPATQNLNTIQSPLAMNIGTSPTSPFDLASPFYHLHMNPHVQDINLQSIYSTSDEADEQQQSLINERKRKRMISNRESARRSRMRKQRHLDELWSQVVWLRHENQQLMEKLNGFSETHDRVVQENTRLKDEVSGLRQMVADTQHNGTYPAISDLDDINWTESSNQSGSSSSDLI